jgi:hypothetical protein
MRAGLFSLDSFRESGVSNASPGNEDRPSGPPSRQLQRKRSRSMRTEGKRGVCLFAPAGFASLAQRARGADCLGTIRCLGAVFPGIFAVVIPIFAHADPRRHIAPAKNAMPPTIASVV